MVTSPGRPRPTTAPSTSGERAWINTEPIYRRTTRKYENTEGEPRRRGRWGSIGARIVDRCPALSHGSPSPEPDHREGPAPPTTHRPTSRVGTPGGPGGREPCSTGPGRRARAARSHGSPRSRAARSLSNGRPVTVTLDPSGGDLPEPTPTRSKRVDDERGDSRGYPPFILEVYDSIYSDMFRILPRSSHTVVGSPAPTFGNGGTSNRGRPLDPERSGGLLSQGPGGRVHASA